MARRLLTATLIVATSCLGTDKAPTGPVGITGTPQFLISDATQPGGTAGFYFLPPMVSHPTFSGTFDYDIAAISPVVAICDVTSGPDVACGSSAEGATPAIRIFTMNTNPPVAVDFEKYKVNWDTGEDGFVSGRVYRIHVFAGPARRELGFADVLLTQTPGQVKKASGEIIVLKDGRTLPIHFRIETGVVPRVGPARSLELTGLPATLPSGATASVTVTARDEHGNVASGYRGTIVFSSSNASATLPTEYTFTEADAGTHTFADAVSFLTAGTTTVRAADNADETIFGEVFLTVQPLAAARLELTGLTDPSEAGAVNSMTVTALDVNGNVATGYLGTIAFTSNDAHATLPANYTFTAEDAGVHAFPASATLRTAGTRTVRATDNADPGIFVEASITVLPSSAVALEVTGVSNPIEAGVASSITVTARDASGNVATNYVGTIAFTSSDAQATLPANYTFTAEDAGTHAFPASVTLRTAGPATVTATDDATSSITGSQPVTVTPAAASTLVLSGIPEQSVAGVAYDFTVTMKDAFGNVATGYGGTVQFSSTDAAATVPAPYAFQPEDAGVRAFPGGVTFRTAGPGTFTAADAAAPSIAATVATQVAAGPAAELRFIVQPMNAVAAEAIAPPVVVTAYDAFANQVSAFTGVVHIAIGANPSGGVLSGTVDVAAVAGVTTFSNLAINQAGTGYTLVASSAGLTGATSDPFSIIAPTPVEVHWINPAGGNWSVASNWSTGTVPTAEQTALIDLPGTYTVSVNVDASVNSLSLGAVSGTQTLANVIGRSLSFLTSANVLGTGRLTLNNTTVNGAGPLAVASGGVVLFVGSNTVNAAVVNAGSLIAGTGSFAANATISGLATVAGSLVRVQAGGSNSSSITVANGFTNHGTIELTKVLDQFGTTFLVVNNGTLVNAADGTITIAVGSGGGRTLTAQLHNLGTVNVLQTLTLSRAAADHINEGTINLTSGNLTITQTSGTTPSFTNRGTISVATARTLAISGGSFSQEEGATLDGGGAMTLTSVNAAFATAFTLGSLTLSSSIGSLAADMTTATTALSMTNSTLNGTGTVTNAAGETVSLSVTNTINTPFVNAGILASGVPPFVSTNTINGPFSTVAGSLVRVQAGGSNSASLTFANGFTNHGTIELTKASDVFGAATLTVINGTLVNASDGTIRSAVGSGGGRILNAQLDNQGAVNVLQQLTINRASSSHINRAAGSISLTSGSLAITQSGTTPSFTNNGTIAVASGLTVSITGGSFTHATGATLEGAGTLGLNSVNTAAFATAFTVATLGLNGTVASFASAFTTATTALSMTNSTFNGPGILTNAAGETLPLSQTNTINTAFVNAGTLASGVPPFSSTNTINGAFATVAGSLMRVQAGGSNNAVLTIANGFINQGTIELTKAGDNTGSTTLAVTSGTLVNATQGTIRSGVGSGGTRNLNAQIDNQGTVNVLHPLTITRAGAAHLNSGTIAVTGGDLVLTATAPLPSLANSGTIDVATGRTVRAAGAVSNATTGSIAGPGTLDHADNVTFTNAGSVTTALARIRSAFVSTGSFAPTTVEFSGTITTIPVGAGYSYTNVRLLTGLTFAGSVTVAGNVTIPSGRLAIGAHTITVNGDFVTQTTGFLTMQIAAGVLAIGGNAAFGGASTNIQLTAGTLHVAGNFTQAGGSNAAFAASASHLTVLNGTAAQTVSFATPGTATTLSHFQRLEIANASAAGVTIGAVFANGQLRTAAGATVARTIRSTLGQPLRVRGLDADGLVFDSVPLLVMNGEALTRFDNAVFQNMNPSTVQFRLDRQNDVVTFNNIAFLTPPAGGFYLQLVDTDAVGPLFTVTMQGTQPANHGGRIIESIAGQLVGWPF